MHLSYNHTCIYVHSCTGQCEIRNLQVRDSTRYIYLEWDCDQPDNEFDFTYQLINAGMCDTGGDTGFPVLNLPDPSPNSNTNSRYFDKLNGVTDVYFNSTYLFTVQPKQWQPGSGYVYGPRSEGVRVTTSELPESKF